MKNNMNPLITKIQESANGFKDFLPLFQDQELEDETKTGVYDCGISAKMVNEQINTRAKYKLSKILNFHRSSLISLFQANIERLEVEKEEVREHCCDVENCSCEEIKFARNDFIDQEITFMRETIKSLENV